MSRHFEGIHVESKPLLTLHVAREMGPCVEDTITKFIFSFTVDYLCLLSLSVFSFCL